MVIKKKEKKASITCKCKSLLIYSEYAVCFGIVVIVDESKNIEMPIFIVDYCIMCFTLLSSTWICVK